MIFFTYIRVILEVTQNVPKKIRKDEFQTDRHFVPDENECEDETDKCKENQVCVNYIGTGYGCECKVGYERSLFFEDCQGTTGRGDDFQLKCSSACNSL